ncbi:hypothetical protein SAMN05444170_5295 [Bradyrhizobium erythrophlei]|uniref:Uncharacterized protein n=2 Tax=Bradyrhizobium erythrophlei TaxID=1437360 RepID=A0A1M7UIQ1_9BRAD|nr:hypothetical protein SAMN05444170_5295 [Bradyrhizobium erythrophlei]
MLHGSVRFQVSEAASSTGRSRSASAMAELFAPLDSLLITGGDSRLAINPATNLNEYGCQSTPCPETLSFSSSTATSISERAYERAQAAREAVMRSAIDVGIEAAFDERLEEMRNELRFFLGLKPAQADVVFSPSGTDSQLQALFLVRALLGPELVSVVVAADQTGSGTVNTSRGCHFSATTANGSRVQKGEPITGLASALTSVALPLFDESGEGSSTAASDAVVFAAVERAVAGGDKVLLQVMDSSKFGWRAPSDECVEAIKARWPDQVQVVVDACQMRLGRARLKGFLDRGHIVIVTGSKFFTGPPFSGALLVPGVLASRLDAASAIPSGLLEYSSRSDWPQNWPLLRSRFPVRMNFGQWLRWEAGIEEIGAYYRVPDSFRQSALATFGKAVEKLIADAPSLELLPWQERAIDAADEEMTQRTIFSFVVRRDERLRSLEECRTLYRALAGNGTKHSAAQPCLIGQPVALGRDPSPPAALRISASARLVSEAWSPNADMAHRNLRRAIDQAAAAIASLESMLADASRFEPLGASHGS